MRAPLSPRPPSAVSVLALLMSLAGAAALAQPVGPQTPSQRLTPEQKAKVFPDQRRLALQDHQERMAILRQGEVCINAARDAEALHQCLRKQRDVLRDQHRRQSEALRAIYQRYGLPAPEMRRLERPNRVKPVTPGTQT